MKFIKLSTLFIFIILALGLCSCSEKAETRTMNYDSYSYHELSGMIEKLSIDLSQTKTRLESVSNEEHLLTSYIQVAKSSQYAVTYIMTGLYTDRNGLLYNVYTENADDYYFEQYALCDDEEGKIQKDDITFLLGISGKYYERDAETGIHETADEKELSLFFEEFSYVEAYEVCVSDEKFYCEVWEKEADKPYYFYFKDKTLLAAQTCSSTGKNIDYYFITFSDFPDETKLNALTQFNER